MAASSGFGDVAVTPHDLATHAAMEIYALGGNAVDASVAANAVQGVVAPETCGIGGDLFALVHRPGGAAPAALNASGRAGSGVDAAALRRSGLASIPFDHPASVTVPGCVDGWVALLTRFGSMPLPEVLSPAIRYAEDGFTTSEDLASALTRRRAQLEPVAPELFATDPPKPGARLTRPDLARTLRLVADGGREAFYQGTPGKAISDALDGRITADDLAVRQAEWVDPISAEIFGRTGWTIPPNSQGYLTLASAWIFSELEPPRRLLDGEYLHLQIEAYRSVAWERDDLVADPERIPLAPDRLVAPDRLRERVRAIDRFRAGIWPQPGPVPGGTAYLSFVDRNDMAVSLIQSNFMGIGSGIAASGAGFFLHDRGAGFNLIPGHPNELTPGSRPLHTLSPTLWTRNGRLDAVLGTRGGHYQPQLLLQMATALFHTQTDVEQAQENPRWVLDDPGPGTSSSIDIEGRMPDALIGELERRGHRIERAADYERGWGPVSVIQVAEDGLRTAAADPRVATARAAVR
ncbi:MAG: gamma-glutamyltranspeptidase [Gammaproteobacteria bacterium]|nr:gamma-glutamyltranspeptidase [Gammaproteobacteria bacterium]